MEYIETHIPYIDTSRAIAAGPSYGGYMMNYIAGQPLAKKFRTLISHAGIFSMISMLASDAPGNVLGSFGAVPWSGSSPDPALNHWDVFDPARYTHNWTQPMLIIHNERDLLVPISQGLAAYSLCQMKGIPSRFLSFPDESHGVSKPENLYHWYKTILGWSNRYAGVEGGLELEEPVTRRANRGGGV
jgi:dipeptidyl aminopeptidase/acylaminoacyl peptidase